MLVIEQRSKACFDWHGWGRERKMFTQAGYTLKGQMPGSGRGAGNLVGKRQWMSLTSGLKRAVEWQVQFL